MKPFFSLKAWEATLPILAAFLATAVAAQPLPPRAGGPSQSAARNADDLLQRAGQAAGPRVRQATNLGARTERTADGRSFVLIWTPPGQPAGWIATLHGSHSWAYDEIVLWQPYAQRHNLGIIAPQWWLGGGEALDDYLLPPLVRREFERQLRAVGATPENTLLHGFSRGAANLYALVAMDRKTPSPLFTRVVANAGGMTADFPPNRDIERGSATPYAGTRWWLWCGGRDPNPDRDGCAAMRRSRDWLAQLGADAALTEDAAGSHGGFHRNSQNVDKALDWFLHKR